MSTILFAAYIAKPVAAAPIQNTTASRDEIAASWVPDPPGRGTWNLLYSCVFTIVLCVWTSVHLNVPGHGEGPLIMFRRKLKWVVIALLAPEFVVFTAFHQWWLARAFLRELQKLQLASSDFLDKISPHSAHKFDISYAMYAVMGGLGADIEHLHNKLKRGTLTTDGLLLLAQHGHFIYVDRETIEDKSKANLLAKGLVCVQVLWVAGQAIERSVAGFPISLLEYHTLVHVFCALIMYALWIRKPYDIQSPSLIVADEFPDILAFIVASTSWTGHSGFKSGKPKKFPSWIYPDRDPKFSWFGSMENSVVMQESHVHDEPALDTYDPRIQNHFLRFDPSSPDVLYPAQHVGQTFVPVAGVDAHLSLSTGQALRSGLGPWVSGGREQFWPIGSADHIDLSEKDVRRLDGAAAFIRRAIESLPTDSAYIGAFDPNYQLYEWKKTTPAGRKNVPIQEPFRVSLAREYGSKLISFRRKNVDNIEHSYYSSAGGTKIAAVLGLVAVSAAYGAIHLAAGSSHFPTSLEFILWRSSCYILLGSLGLFISTYFAYSLISRLRWEMEWLENLITGMTSTELKTTVFVGSMLVVVIVVSLLYIAARGYIVVESFISLRHVPARVYETPDTNFMSYVPHL